MVDEKIKNICLQAKKLDEKIKKEQEKEYFQKVIAWLSFVGLVESNLTKPYRSTPTLKDFLKAGKIEPRINELLPAIMRELNFAIKHQRKDIPEDLKLTLAAIEANQNFPLFRSIKPKQYLQWLGSPAIELAKKRLSHMSKPRQREVEESNNLGQIISEERIKLGFTQKHFAKEFGISLRALRDLEQGYDNVALSRVKEILLPLEKKLTIL